jgi:hypothetical protein
MSPEAIANLFEMCLQAGIGLYLIALGFRWIGKKPGVSERYDQWQGRVGGYFKVAGPLLIVIAVVLFAFKPTRAKTAAADWTLVKTEDGKASVLMPGKPEDSTQTVDGEFGKINVHVSKDVVISGKIIYVFNYADHPPDTFEKKSEKEFFRTSTLGTLASVEGKLIEEKESTRNGLKGNEVRLNSPSKHASFHAWTTIQKSRVYSLTLITHESVKEPEESEKFFDSFKINEADQAEKRE